MKNIPFLSQGLEALARAFDRWDQELMDKRGSMRAVSLLGTPVVSGDALPRTYTVDQAWRPLDSRPAHGYSVQSQRP